MMKIRRSAERGHADHGWLNARHSFSFANYYDPAHMGFRTLRVINEDRVAAGAGFGTHGHQDMEIFTYMLDGQLAHKDSMGNGSVLVAGDVQRMTAGTGVRHSEMNGSQEEPAHLLQIWIEPEAAGLTPSYEEKQFSDADKRGRLRLIAAQKPRDGAVKIHQDVSIYASVLGAGDELNHKLDPGRHGWVQVIRGQVSANGETLSAGDAAALSDEPALQLVANEETELLVFDLT
ncbi:MAG: pirin family protein [Acidobacteriota bacterium]|nr:pirin family protein [Acidobacteriota bacterium]MDH3785685.1 pirin family protein [Acidobacteriota bacterium]